MLRRNCRRRLWLMFRYRQVSLRHKVCYSPHHTSSIIFKLTANLLWIKSSTHLLQSMFKDECLWTLRPKSICLLLRSHFIHWHPYIAKADIWKAQHQFHGTSIQRILWVEMHFACSETTILRTSICVWTDWSQTSSGSKNWLTKSEWQI